MTEKWTGTRWAVRVYHETGDRAWLIGGDGLQDTVSHRAEWSQRWAAIKELDHMREREPDTVYRLVRLTRKSRAEKIRKADATEEEALARRLAVMLRACLEENADGQVPWRTIRAVELLLREPAVVALLKEGT